MTKRDHAVALARKGFHVFPIDNDRPLDGWQNIATTDPAKVHRLWTDPVFDSEVDYNIGIATGVPFNGKILNALDVDVKDGKRGDKSLSTLEAIYDPIPETRRHRTTSGGKHILLLTDAPLANSVGKVGTGLDIRGRGGFIYAPGSERKGGSYSVEFDAPIADCPEWLITMAGSARARPAVSGETLGELDRPDAIKRAIDYLETQAPEALEGDGGDTTTYAVAARVGDFGISREQCFDLMADHWNETKADPPWDPDDLQTKVDNAYAHRTSPVGTADPEVEFDAVAPKPAAKSKSKLWLEWWKDAKPDLDQPYLIDDIYDLSTMVVTYGESNGGKTYVVLDQAFAIATGRDWNGHKTHQGLVVYVAAEGGRGFRKRIEAFRRHYGAQDIPFALVPCPVDLFSATADSRALIDMIREAEATVGQKCVMVVVDTLARAMGGGDENSGADMGVMLRNCDRIRESTGATLHLIHHSGKDKAKGARGWSGLRGHIDTEIEVEPGGMEVTKQRDMEKATRMAFQLVGAEIGRRTDGRAVTACVVEWLSESEFENRLTPDAQKLLDLLEQMIDARKDEIEAENSDNPDKAKLLQGVKIPWSEWQNTAQSCLKGSRGKPIARTALFPLRLELSNSGLVSKDAKNQWFIQ